jgi:hypothetical protein
MSVIDKIVTRTLSLSAKEVFVKNKHDQILSILQADFENKYTEHGFVLKIVKVIEIGPGYMHKNTLEAVTNYSVRFLVKCLALSAGDIIPLAKLSPNDGMEKVSVLEAKHAKIIMAPSAIRDHKVTPDDYVTVSIFKNQTRLGANTLTLNGTIYTHPLIVAYVLKPSLEEEHKNICFKLLASVKEKAQVISDSRHLKDIAYMYVTYDQRGVTLEPFGMKLQKIEDYMNAKNDNFQIVMLHSVIPREELLISTITFKDANEVVEFIKKMNIKNPVVDNYWSGLNLMLRRLEAYLTMIIDTGASVTTGDLARKYWKTLSPALSPIPK